MQKGKVFLFYVFLLFSGSLLLTPSRADAGYWGEATAATFLKQSLEKAYNYMQNTLVGNLKVAAYQFLSQQITSIISGRGMGSGSGAQFIMNWENFMYGQAEQATRVAVNDFFTETLRGTDSSSTYVAAGSSEGYGGGTSYPQYLRANAEATIFDEQPKYTLDQFCSDPSTQMFTAEHPNCFLGWMEPMNNVFGYSMEAERVANATRTRQQEIAKAKAIAYNGFKGVEDKKTGQTTTPGTVIKGIFDSLNNQLIGMPSQAKSPEEVATMTASTFVSSLLKQALQQGLARVENEVTTLASQKINQGISTAVSKMGPAGQFLNNSGATASIQNGTNRWLLGTGQQSTSYYSSSATTGSTSAQTSGSVTTTGTTTSGSVTTTGTSSSTTVTPAQHTATDNFNSM